MLRSFTDRLFGGVCGGLSSTLRINSWVLRLLFLVLAVLSAGAFAVLYLILWWLVPQQRLTVERQGGLPVLLVFLFIALTAGFWFGRDQGWWNTTEGTTLYLPILALVLSVVFFLRQVKA